MGAWVARPTPADDGASHIDEPAWLGASELAQALRRGELSVAGVVESLLARIAERNPALNAIVTLDAAHARQRARDADAALQRGEVWGPLHGVPVTIKDSFDTAGLRTTSGWPAFATRVPTEDAPPVARLRQAGAIVLGKTNLPPLANGIQSDNRVFGRTNNPWDLRRTPGGSSGGAAAAICAGLSYLELGSDIGGSIRIPSHFCGIYGLKMTAGRISGQGHVASARPLSLPAGWQPLLQLASFGPIARSVEDLRLAAGVLAAPATPPLPPPAPRRIDGLRIAWTDDLGGAPLSADSRQAMQAMAERLRGAGAQVSKAAPGIDFPTAWHAAGVCLGAINTLFRPLGTQWLRRLASPLLRRVGPRDALMQGLFTGMALDDKPVQRALALRTTLIEDIERFLRDCDVFACPVFPTAAFTHRAPGAAIEVDGEPLSELEANLLHNVLFNLSGHPVVTLPIGLSAAGLPLAVQLVGRRWHEAQLLDAAAQIDAVVQGYRRPPAAVLAWR